ncbi:unnamed protein product [Phytophthora lilii]|uniref:Unnamed protein product n=1 Tax=Phytophthora lilii TaxID=2077276 RepID=A0A9W6X2A0_9STRA|nr:unnamed protein product [Phytophthora lilii]
MHPLMIFAVFIGCCNVLATAKAIASSVETERTHINDESNHRSLTGVKTKSDEEEKWKMPVSLTSLLKKSSSAAKNQEKTPLLPRISRKILASVRASRLYTKIQLMQALQRNPAISKGLKTLEENPALVNNLEGNPSIVKLQKRLKTNPLEFTKQKLRHIDQVLASAYRDSESGGSITYVL